MKPTPCAVRTWSEWRWIIKRQKRQLPARGSTHGPSKVEKKQENPEDYDRKKQIKAIEKDFIELKARLEEKGWFDSLMSERTIANWEKKRIGSYHCYWANLNHPPPENYMEIENGSKPL